MKKIGIFGGSFNPIHIGHMNSVKTVKAHLSLDQVYVVPANVSPLDKMMDGPEAQHRLNMVKAAFQNEGDEFLIKDYEIEKGGTSFTIESIEHFQQSEPEADFYLIIGSDQFENFERWKDYQEILLKVHLVVTSRPGEVLPQDLKSLSQMAEGATPTTEGYYELQNGRRVYYVQLEDIDVSSTEIRRQLRQGANMDSVLPEEVNRYIKDKSLYEPVKEKIGDFEQFTKKCCEWLNEKNAIRIKAYDLTDLDRSSEYTIVASANSKRHTSALAEQLIRFVKTEYHSYPINSEGLKEGRWVVIDYGALIIHLFYDFTRQEYWLEELWEDGKEMALNLPRPQPVNISEE